jgi:hypothetical protein
MWRKPAEIALNATSCATAPYVASESDTDPGNLMCPVLARASPVGANGSTG